MDTKQVDQLVWHVAWTHYRSEIRARSSLEQRGYTVLAPTQLVRIKHANRKLIAERPMFPRYLFVGLPRTGSWYPIISSVGIGGLITNDYKPVAVPTWIMRNLLHAQETNAFTKKVETIETNEGDKVRFKGGPFEGFIGTVQRASPSRRVSVLVEMFGKKTEFSIPLADLAMAG